MAAVRINRRARAKHGCHGFQLGGVSEKVILIMHKINLRRVREIIKMVEEASTFFKVFEAPSLAQVLGPIRVARFSEL